VTGRAETRPRQFATALAAPGPQLIECRVALPEEFLALEDAIHRAR